MINDTPCYRTFQHKVEASNYLILVGLIMSCIRYIQTRSIKGEDLSNSLWKSIGFGCTFYGYLKKYVNGV